MRAMTGSWQRAVVRSSIEESCELIVLYVLRKHEKLELQCRRSVGGRTEQPQRGSHYLYNALFDGRLMLFKFDYTAFPRQHP